MACHRSKNFQCPVLVFKFGFHFEIQCVQDGFSKVQVTLNSVEGDLKEELKYKKQFLSWLEEFKDLHVDTTKFSEGILQENQRINGVLQLLTKTLKVNELFLKFLCRN